jgi:hypothetical protein
VSRKDETSFSPSAARISALFLPRILVFTMDGIMQEINAGATK